MPINNNTVLFMSISIKRVDFKYVLSPQTKKQEEERRGRSKLFLSLLKYSTLVFYMESTTPLMVVITRRQRLLHLPWGYVPITP